MTRSEIENKSLEERYASYTDNEIREVLVKRKHFRQEAVDLAVQIAIDRGIIHSEQDLLGPDFEDKKQGFSFFPEISDSYLHRKFQRSMFRALYIVGLIPIIFGIMKYSELEVKFSSSAIVLGIVWLIMTFVLQRKRITSMIYGHFAVLLAVIWFVFGYFMNPSQIKPLDVAIFLIVIGMPVYLLLYIRKVFSKDQL